MYPYSAKQECGNSLHIVNGRMNASNTLISYSEIIMTRIYKEHTIGSFSSITSVYFAAFYCVEFPVCRQAGNDEWMSVALVDIVLLLLPVCVIDVIPSDYDIYTSWQRWVATESKCFDWKFIVDCRNAICMAGITFTWFNNILLRITDSTLW